MAHSATFFLLRFRSLALGIILLASLSASVVGCKKDSSSTPLDDQDAIANVKLATSATLGTYLSDANGNTLYFFARDVDGANTCTSAACNPMWPVYYEATVKVPKALKAEDFATKTTADGRLQTTYKGWPLYYYAPAAGSANTREAAGLTGGNAVGGIWHVVNPGYGVVLASKSVEDKTTRVVSSKTYLTDALGRSLYYFAMDNTSPTTQPTNCTGGCAAIWPALYMSAPATPSTLRSTDFSTITREAGTTSGPYGTTTLTRTQLTYKGHPLYYYVGDNA
ncbi:MAG: hypothetical protein JWR44_3830, partial [Hymenobacter sp.]|nr:hypothetical protein [Hymenobacter sp.]